MKDALGALHEDWRGRRLAIAELASAQGDRQAITAERLVDLIRTESLDLGVLNGALQTLVALGAPALPRLEPLLTHPWPEVRQSAAVVLGQLEAPLGVPLLRVLLEDLDSNVRFHAIEALGQQGALVAVPRLLELAVSGDAFLGFAALEALAKIQDPSALPELIELLEDPVLAGSAAQALGRIGHPLAWRPLLRILSQLEEAPQALESLVRDNPQLPVILTAEQRQVFQRHELFFALEREGELELEQIFRSSTSALEVIEAGAQERTLLWALEVADPEVRLAAAEALARRSSASDRVLAVLLEFLAEHLERVALALGALGRPEALPHLLPYLSHPSLRTRRLLVEQGLRLGTPAAELEAFLSCSDPGLRGSAARWLLAGGALSTSRLGELLEKEADERTRCELLEELPVDSDGLVLLQQRLEKGSRAEAILITRLMARWPAEQGLSLLARGSDLWSCIYLCRTLGEWRVRPAWLEEMLDDLRPPVRAEAAKALARVDAETARRRLPSLLLDAELDVAEAALLALAEIQCWEPVRQALEEDRLRSRAWRALAQSPDPSDLALVPLAHLLEARSPAALGLLLQHLPALSRSQIEELRVAISALNWQPGQLPASDRRLLPLVLPRSEALVSDADAWVRRGAYIQEFDRYAERAGQDSDDKIRHFVTRVGP